MRVSVRLGRASYIIPGLGLLSALILAGCGSDKGSVYGEVKFGGQPLPSGTVSFHCEGGDYPVKSSEILDGKYSISDLPFGPAKITVRTTRPSGPARSLEGKIISPPTPPSRYVPILPKYGMPEQSGLNYEVKSGIQMHDIDLAP